MWCRYIKISAQIVQYDLLAENVSFLTHRHRAAVCVFRWHFGTYLIFDMRVEIGGTLALVVLLTCQNAVS